MFPPIEGLSASSMWSSLGHWIFSNAAKQGLLTPFVLLFLTTGLSTLKPIGEKMLANSGYVMTLANSIIGVGILAMPFCFQKVCMLRNYFVCLSNIKLTIIDFFVCNMLTTIPPPLPNGCKFEKYRYYYYLLFSTIIIWNVFCMFEKTW